VAPVLKLASLERGTAQLYDTTTIELLIYQTMQNKNIFTRFNTKTRLSSNIVTMFSLSKEKSLLRVLTKYAWKVISIATGKTKVAPRLRRFNKFFLLLVKYNKDHGTAFTIKWLKACHLAVQRKLSSKPCQSLRDIDPSIPLPRLINGLPTFIGTMDRKAIRNNHPGTIRLWLSILSVYRLLKGPLNPKLNTITDLYKGELSEIDKILSQSRIILNENKDYFNRLPSLSAHSFVKSLKAGPNGSVAIQNVLTDAIGLAKYSEIYEQFRIYSLLTKSHLIFKLDNTIEWLFATISEHGTSWVKLAKGMSFDDICLGKLAFKEEAAGKLRVFAIADIWTQSLFYPLHMALFEFLKRLPNDGTFDQDSSFKRCLDKAVLYNCAYSVDLSSATDRLPIKLQSGIINLMFKIPGLGEAWSSILCMRPYFIRKNEYGIEQGHLIYGTGQPMGALSSWAMLATTHHLILQVCAQRAYPGINSWYTRYEILGDDLVIFDNKVYQEYVDLMILLDVGTNPSKSLFSEQLSALEFAKRTGVNGIDVSGISWKQFISDPSLMGRINLLIHFANKGLVQTIPMLLTIIGKAKGDNSILRLLKVKDSKSHLLLDQSLMALLGYFVHSNKITLKDAVAFTIDPRDEDLENLDKPSLPSIMTLHEILNLFNNSLTDPWEPTRISNFDERRDTARTEVIGYMADSIARDALSKALMLCNNYDLLLDGFAVSLVGSKLILGNDKGKPFNLSKDANESSCFNRIQLAQLRSFSEMILLNDEDPQDLHDEVYDFMYKLRDLPSMKEAMKFSTLVENLEARFKFESNSRATGKSPIAWLHKDIMNAGKATVTPYHRLIA